MLNGSQKLIFPLIITLFLSSCAHFKSARNQDSEILDDLGEKDASFSKRSSPMPFAKLTDHKIFELLKNDITALGSISIGNPSGGRLIGGLQMPDYDAWDIVDPEESWGTKETIDFIASAINKTRDKFPDMQKIFVGDIGKENGGHLGRHLSHQSGRDADLGWCYRGDHRWWTRGTKQTLDLEKTWAFIKSLITETDVELILIDRSIQQIIYQHALNSGEERVWLDKIFQFPKGDRHSLIRHARGHKTHMHVRFYNKMAQELGRRSYAFLLEEKIVQPPAHYVYHKVTSGQTLGHLAKRYGTTISVIKKANGLKSNLIRAGKSYRIPRRGGIITSIEPIVIPARMIPPTLSKKEPLRSKSASSDL